MPNKPKRYRKPKITFHWPMDSRNHGSDPVPFWDRLLLISELRPRARVEAEIGPIPEPTAIVVRGFSKDFIVEQEWALECCPWLDWHEKAFGRCEACGLTSKSGLLAYLLKNGQKGILCRSHLEYFRRGVRNKGAVKDEFGSWAAIQSVMERERHSDRVFEGVAAGLDKEEVRGERLRSWGLCEEDCWGGLHWLNRDFAADVVRVRAKKRIATKIDIERLHRRWPLVEPGFWAVGARGDIVAERPPRHRVKDKRPELPRRRLGFHLLEAWNALLFRSLGRKDYMSAAYRASSGKATARGIPRADRNQINRILALARSLGPA